MTSSIAYLDDNSVVEYIKSGLVLIDIKTNWCAPCRKMIPIINELSLIFKNKLKIGILDADSNAQFITKFYIRTIPTIILYKNNKEIFRNSGFISLEELSEKINENL